MEGIESMDHMDPEFRARYVKDLHTLEQMATCYVTGKPNWYANYCPLWLQRLIDDKFPTFFVFRGAKKLGIPKEDVILRKPYIGAPDSETAQ